MTNELPSLQSLEKLAVCGAGLMGSWISAKLLKTGLPVVVFDTNEEALKALKANPNVPGALQTSSNLEEAAHGARFFLETANEDPSIKRRIFSDAASLLGEGAIYCSNTSLLLPDEFLPEDFPFRHRFACFHFNQPNTTVDIMKIAETEPTVVAFLVEIAKAIGEEPIVLEKVSRGYVGSAMASAAADVALALVARGVVDPETADRSWKALTGMPVGLFMILDQIGLDTSLMIRKARLSRTPNDQQLKEGVDLLERYVTKGHLGAKSGEGFFKYPNKT